MHADVIAMDVGGDVSPFAGIERKADALLQFREKSAGGPAMFEEEKFETGLFPALPQNFTGAKYLRYTANDRDDLFGPDESIECDGEVRIGGKTAANAKSKAYFGLSCATSRGGGEAEVVNFGIRAPMAKAGD